MLFKGRTIALNGFNRFALMLVALGIANSLLPGPAAAKTLAAWVELIGFDTVSYTHLTLPTILRV